MKIQKLKDSGELVGKKVNLCYSGTEPSETQQQFVCVIDAMEQDGILVHYYTDSDSSSICEEDDDDSYLTQTYVPWNSIHFIDYREDESYP